ncbi:unnamed protein product [Alopecurus aequalis]
MRAAAGQPEGWTERVGCVGEAQLVDELVDAFALPCVGERVPRGRRNSVDNSSAISTGVQSTRVAAVAAGQLTTTRARRVGEALEAWSGAQGVAEDRVVERRPGTGSEVWKTGTRRHAVRRKTTMSAESQTMASTTAAAARHMVALPYPGRGHINPMLVLCRLLVAADGALTVTVVVTVSRRSGTRCWPPRRCRTAARQDGGPFERLLYRLERRPEAVLADTFLTWAVPAGARRGIPVCSLWTQPATFFLALYHLDLWPPVDGGDSQEELSRSLEEYVPVLGLSSVRLSDLNTFRLWERLMEIGAEVFANAAGLRERCGDRGLAVPWCEQQRVLCHPSVGGFLSHCGWNSVLEAVSAAVPLLVFRVAWDQLVIARMVADEWKVGVDLRGQRGEDGTVSRAAISAAVRKLMDFDSGADQEMRRRAAVLQEDSRSAVQEGGSSHRSLSGFLQDLVEGKLDVARDKAAGLRERCGDRGLAVPWCEQQRVLCHPSVGGFLSHCGWNSVLEAVSAAVPLLVFPVVWDQLVIARMVADEWKVGVDLRGQRGEDGTVSRAAISAAVRKLMDFDSGADQEMRRRAAAASVRERCGDRGLAAPWCEQQRVLCHPSVGGFLSHYGWNSVLEAVSAAVPLLVFPVAWDQLVIARMVADEWKVVVDLRGQRGEDGTVSRAAISAAVRQLMDFDSGADQEMRRRAAVLQEDSRSAVQEGGSSHRSLSGFLQDLVEGKLDAASVRERCGDRGLAAPWCEQQRVLCHPSVGGFLSHCGWNSVLEAVSAAVPLLVFPVAWDQLVIARIVADEWKVVVDLRGQRGEDGTVSRAAISAAVRQLMDFDSGADQEMRRRAAVLQEDSRSAVQEGGSSHRSLSGFLQDLVEGKLDAASVRERCGDRGLAAPWCEQQRVLCHPSVGGFLSHCGWNSVLEAVSAAVPLLVFPVAWDQLVIARMVADEWKVVVDLRGQRGEDGTVSRAAISAAVRQLMDFDSGADQEMRRRAAVLQEDSRSAVQEGGSSHRSLSGFLQDLVEGKLDLFRSPAQVEDCPEKRAEMLCFSKHSVEALMVDQAGGPEGPTGPAQNLGDMREGEGGQQFSHISSPVDGGDSQEELSIRSLEEYVPVPGLSSVRLSDLNTFRLWERLMEIGAEVFANVRKAQCVLFTSFHELEPSAINTIAESLPCPVYLIGPSIPQLRLNRDNKIHEEEHREWLDAQPEKSVLYVSFGSYVSMPRSQFEEITMGLRDSGVRFFWVAQDTAADVRQMCGDRGLAVSWCEQQKVLCHPSVGGFLSHCGWNSALEAVSAGVPFLAFPVGWDQLVIARMVADEWKVGVDLREKKGEDGTVNRTAISAAVRKLMDFDSGAGQEMRRRAAVLQEDSRCAAQEGGSSHRSLSGFLQDLVEGKLDVTETSQ